MARDNANDVARSSRNGPSGETMAIIAILRDKMSAQQQQMTAQQQTMTALQQQLANQQQLTVIPQCRYISAECVQDV